MTLLIRPQNADEDSAVRAIVAGAFGHHEAVAELVDALRESWAWVDGLSLVATEDAAIVGHVLLTKALLDTPDRLVDVLVLSPLSVRPDRQRAGIGKALVRAAAQAAEAHGSPLLFLEGDPAYYTPRGFQPGGPLGFRRPSTRIPEPAFQVMPLATYEEWMTGTLVYCDVFWRLDCVGLRPEDGVHAPT
jgi:putative acetyltransferase